MSETISKLLERLGQQFAIAEEAKEEIERLTVSLDYARATSKALNAVLADRESTIEMLESELERVKDREIAADNAMREAIERARKAEKSQRGES